PEGGRRAPLRRRRRGQRGLEREPPARAWRRRRGRGDPVLNGRGDWREIPPEELEWLHALCHQIWVDKSAIAKNTLEWAKERDGVPSGEMGIRKGKYGEWLFSQVSDYPMNASTELHDGGVDFPGLDVKATGGDQLLVEVTKTHAPKAWCLVQVRLE